MMKEEQRGRTAQDLKRQIAPQTPNPETTPQHEASRLKPQGQHEADRYKSSNAKIHVCTYNTQTLRTYDDTSRLVEGLGNIKRHVVGLRETKRRGEGLRELSGGSWMYEAGKTEENANAKGLALLINKNFTDYVEKKPQTKQNKTKQNKTKQNKKKTTKHSDRIISCKIKLHGKNITTIIKAAHRYWTWKAPGGVTKNQIDFILSSDGKIVGNCEVITKVDIGSDHRMVRARVEKDKKKLMRLKKIQKQKPYRLDLRVLQKLAIPIRTELKNRFDTLKYEEPLTKLVKKKHRTRARRKRKELILETLETRKGPRQINKHKNKQTIMSIRKESGEITSDRAEILKICANFYKSPYTQTVPTPESTMKSSPDTEEVPEFTEEEVERGIKRLERHKAQGVDGITSDIIKLGGPIVLTYLINIFNNILKTKQIPDNWHEAKIVILFKKGDPKDIKNYRPINLL